MNKTAFKLETTEEADDAMRDYINHTAKEKLEISYYLTNIAYKFDMDNPPRMDRRPFA